MKDHNSANEFVTKIQGGALDGKLSNELGRLSYDELAEVERILINTMKSRTASKDLETVNHDSSAQVCGESARPWGKPRLSGGRSSGNGRSESKKGRSEDRPEGFLRLNGDATSGCWVSAGPTYLSYIDL
jgi:hypothetical protein